MDGKRARGGAEPKAAIAPATLPSIGPKKCPNGDPWNAIGALRGTRHRSPRRLPRGERLPPGSWPTPPLSASPLSDSLGLPPFCSLSDSLGLPSI